MRCLLVLDRYSRRSVELLGVLVEIREWIEQMGLQIEYRTINAESPSAAEKALLAGLPPISRVPTLVAPDNSTFVGVQDICALFRKNIQEDKKRRRRLIEQAGVQEPDDVEAYMAREARAAVQEDEGGLNGSGGRLAARVSEATAQRMAAQTQPRGKSREEPTGYESDESVEERRPRQRGRGRGRTTMPDSDDEGEPRRGRGRGGEVPLLPASAPDDKDDDLMRKYLENHSGEGYSP